MPTLATLKSRIAADLSRADLTSQIALAIGDAVAEYQPRRFAFNEARDTFVTVAGTEFYVAGTDPEDIPEDIAEVDSLTVTVNGRRCVLDPWAFAASERINTTTSLQGQPIAWAWYTQSIRLYPIPDAAYTITISYLQAIAAPEEDGDSNAWTSEAERLIRASACKRLCRDVLNSPVRAAAYEAAETAAFRSLRRKAQQLSTGALAPSGI